MLVQGAVGLCAVQLARQAGGQVIGTVRAPSDEATARMAGAHEVVFRKRVADPVNRAGIKRTFFGMCCKISETSLISCSQ